jgi:hypothetical protein
MAEENLKNGKKCFLHADFSHWLFCGYNVLNTTTLIHENNTQQNAQQIK